MCIRLGFLNLICYNCNDMNTRHACQLPHLTSAHLKHQAYPKLNIVIISSIQNFHYGPLMRIRLKFLNLICYNCNDMNTRYARQFPHLTSECLKNQAYPKARVMSLNLKLIIIRYLKCLLIALYL